MKLKKSSMEKKISPSAVAREATKIVADVRDFYVAAPDRALISIKKRYDDEPRNLILGLLALRLKLKQIVVFDDGIDIRDPAQVESALRARMRPERDVIIIPHAGNSSLYGPELEPRAIFGWGIDATVPLGQKRSIWARRSIASATRHSARALAAAALCLVLSACGANVSGSEERVSKAPIKSGTNSEVRK
jgi:3-polyprenyl-4-hydroxybenzoate decarboxylase